MRVCFLTLFFLFSPFALASPAQLKFDPQFILEKVLEKKHQVLNPQITAPRLYYSSQTPLKVFQDAIEKQWGFRPKEITNAYALESNAIFLYDDQDYYTQQERCMDDSLAHEFVHFVQAKYQHFDLNDESLEWDAVDIQTEFRHEFCQQ